MKHAMWMMLATLAGCVGTIGDGSDDTIGDASQALTCPERAPEPSCNGVVAGDDPVRMLTRAEYNRTVRDLLGDASAPASYQDDTVGLFDNNAKVAVDEGRLVVLRDLARSLAADASLDGIVPCDPGNPGDEIACVHGFLDGFARRAFRRPLDADERDRYVALFDKLRAPLDADGSELDFGSSMRTLLEAILQSPIFLYHLTDPSSEDGTVPLGPFELASRLSYFLWGSMPDDELLDAAESGALDTEQGLYMQALRLLADGRAREGLRSFFAQCVAVLELQRAERRRLEASPSCRGRRRSCRGGGAAMSARRRRSRQAGPAPRRAPQDRDQARRRAHLYGAARARHTDSYVHRVEMEMDLIVEALTCEIANVITMQWDGFASDRKFPELPGDFANIGHHTGAHNGSEFGNNGAEQREFLRMVDQWYAARIAYLIGELANRQLGDGTSLLDHTAVLWCHEQAEGGNHARCDMPYLLVGSCGGRLRTGIARDFGGRHGPDGDGAGAVRGPQYASNKLFMALSHAMGAPTDSFGDMSLSSAGPFDDLLV